MNLFDAHRSYKEQEFSWFRYFLPILMLLGFTLIVLYAGFHLDLLVLAMLYLLLNVFVAVRFGQGPAFATTFLTLLVIDYFFVPPYFAWSVVDSRYWVMYGVMLGVILLVSRLTIQSRQSTHEALVAEMEVKRERLVSSLLSSVSHDLRTPLTSISGAASILLEGESRVSSEDRKQLLSSIYEESLRLNRFVEKILQITKIESGNIQIKKEIHSVEELLGGVLHRLDAALKGRSLSLELLSDIQAPFDPLLIEQVLVNLIENAIRYSPQNSPIDLKVYNDSRQVCIEVMDRGPGLLIQDQNQIFEKFYRGEKKESFGSGLGLAICQGIIKIHQGKIGVRNREAGGAIFYFTLPLFIER